MPALEAARADRPITAPSRLAGARAFVELFHFPPIFMVLLACAIFATIAADGSPPAGRLIPYLAAVLFSQMAIGIHNDYCDRDLDRAAKPWRAIPSGVVSPALALEMTGALLALALAFALPLGVNVAALGVLGTASGFAYNARLKGTMLAWAPFWVALPTLVVASFTVVHDYRSELLLTYVIGLPLVISVYIADTMTDIASDRALGVRGFAVWLGSVGARLVCWGGANLRLRPRHRALAVRRVTRRSLRDVRGACSSSPSRPTVSASPRVHWLAIMLAVIALAADWLLYV